MIERFFKLQENRTNIRTEIIAGITTFLTMSYILFVNASILGDAGMEKSAVMIATAFSAGLTTIIMGLWTNYPIALASGMGLNAYFAYSVCNGMKIPWQVALGAVFLDGVIFIIISALLPFREEIIKSVPPCIKYAISVGIGLFISLIGLENAGIVIKSESTLISLGKVNSPSVLLFLFGLFVLSFLLIKKIKGAILLGILITTIAGLFIGDGKGGTITPHSLKLFALPEIGIISKTFLKLDILGALKVGIITVIFTFTFIDIFDTAGTVIGLGTKLNIIDNSTGTFPKAWKVLTTDAIGTVIGAICGTSTVTSYIESASGVAEGGRTGLTALITGILLLLSIFFWPLVNIIPKEAVAPVLLIVGFMMIEPMFKINFVEFSEGFPAFITILFMPLTYSIANGIIFGITSYTFIGILTGKLKEMKPLMYVLTLIFLGYLFFFK